MKHNPIHAPEAPVTRKPCSDCDGRGGWLATVNVSGEAMDADQREVICESCEGRGYFETDPECPCCEAVLVNGWCADCEGFGFAPLIELQPESKGYWL